MTTLLQVSDPHFGTEQPPVVEALVRLVNEQRPELVVMSGDITQRARRGQFDAALAFTQRLGTPVLVVPGNHDIPLLDLAARVGWPYAGYRRVFGRELEPEHVSDRWMVLGVNTTRAHRHSHGEVSSAQIERVARRLEGATPSQLRVVVVHQPVAVTRPEDRRHLLRGYATAVQRWAAAGADIVMGGHIHLPYILPLPNGPRPSWAVQAGTAVSARVRDGLPNSVNLLRWNDPATPAGVCRVQRWDHDAAAQSFVCHSVTDLAPERSTHAR